MTAAGRLAGRCEHCRPAGIKAGQSAAPLSHLRRQLPLQGSHQTAGACKGSPARGAGCVARRRLRGAVPCGANIRPGHRAGAQRRCKSRRSSLCGCGGKVLPPAGIKVGQSAAPLSHLRRQLPLQGSHQTAGACKGSPARGTGCAARRRLKGAAPCGANIRPCHRAGAQRRCKSRRSSLCGCGGKVLPPRRDKGRAKCRTPQSPAVTAPLTGEPSNGRCLQRLPCKGSWLRRKAQTEGCRALRCKYPSGPSRRRAAPA